MSRTQNFVVTLGLVSGHCDIFRERIRRLARTPVCAGRPRIVDSDSLDANVSRHLFS
ncbi:hypothetical protein BDR04DRAFT_1098083 [Suillus decipiens]|nr:hypothetical protein BDR04DRAFT_1098083 [Suillus decipiens]